MDNVISEKSATVRFW